MPLHTPYDTWNEWLETYVENLKDAGGGMVRGRCPNPDHSDYHPSFNANRNEYWYNCFSCGARGNAVQFAKMLNLDYSIFNGFDFKSGTYTTTNQGKHTMQTNTNNNNKVKRNKSRTMLSKFSIEFQHVGKNRGMIRPVCYSCKKILQKHEEGMFIWSDETAKTTILVHRGMCERRVVLTDHNGEPIMDESTDGKKSYRHMPYSCETIDIFKTYRKGRGKWKTQTVNFY